MLDLNVHNYIFYIGCRPLVSLIFSDRSREIATDVQRLHKVETEVLFYVVDIG